MYVFTHASVAVGGEQTVLKYAFWHKFSFYKMNKDKNNK